MIAHPVDRIRVWNEETREMFAPETMPELLVAEWNRGNVCGRNAVSQPLNQIEAYINIVFMRNTGIYDQTLAARNRGSSIEIFDGDLITCGSEPYLFRVVQNRGCWLAFSLSEDAVSLRLIDTWNPRVVGNVFENPDMARKGTLEIDECDPEV